MPSASNACGRLKSEYDVFLAEIEDEEIGARVFDDVYNAANVAHAVARLQEERERGKS